MSGPILARGRLVRVQAREIPVRITRISMIKGINISTQWEISIDIKIEDVQPQWASVFHVSKGFTGTVGDRIPETV